MSVELGTFEENLSHLKSASPAIAMTCIEKFVMGTGNFGDGMIARNYHSAGIDIVVGRLLTSLTTYWGGANKMSLGKDSATLSYSTSAVKYSHRILDGGPVVRPFIPELGHRIEIWKTWPRPVHDRFDAMADKQIDIYVDGVIDEALFG